MQVNRKEKRKLNLNHKVPEMIKWAKKQNQKENK